MFNGDVIIVVVEGIGIYQVFVVVVVLDIIVVFFQLVFCYDIVVEGYFDVIGGCMGKVVVKDDVVVVVVFVCIYCMLVCLKEEFVFGVCGRVVGENVI